MQASQGAGVLADDEDGLDSLRPGRFAGQPADRLTDRALRPYRDIYAST
jgi:hypothetical protein